MKEEAEPIRPGNCLQSHLAVESLTVARLKHEIRHIRALEKATRLDEARPGEAPHLAAAHAAVGFSIDDHGHFQLRVRH